MDLAEVLALNWLSERLTLTMGLFYAYSARITQKVSGGVNELWT
jgi:hypothetical protein